MPSLSACGMLRSGSHPREQANPGRLASLVSRVSRFDF